MSTGFSPERIERALQRSRAFWKNESTEPIVSLYHQPDYRQLANEEAMVARAAACIQADGAGEAEDILPCFLPDFGTVSTAAMWGGEIIPAAGERCIHIHPVVQTLDDLGCLAPCAFEQSDFQRGLDLHRRVCDRLETDDVFVRVPDFQGPMNTLALMMEQTDLLCALYEAPDLVKAALDHITDTLITTVQRFIDLAGRDRVIGMIWPYITLPAELGVAITQDYMPLLSPDLYAEFELPRLKRIADHFGGVFIHCCGQYAHHLPALRRADFHIWGLESAYPATRVTDIHASFGNDIGYVVGVAPDGAAEFPTVIDYARHLASTPCAAARFWFASCHEWCDGEALKQVVQAGFGARETTPAPC